MIDMMRKGSAVGLNAAILLAAWVLLPAPDAAAQTTQPVALAATGTTAQGLKFYREKVPHGLAAFDMIHLPGGKFTTSAGSADGKPREVEIKPFWIGKTEVTWDEYDIFAFRLDHTEAQRAKGVDAKSRPSKPYGPPDRGYGHQQYAALNITYNAAVEYCKWLSAKTGRTYRLPTEEEWEYACRAGGPDAPLPADQLKKVAWYGSEAKEKTHQVGTKQPNAFGLHDMLGNVAEWCSTPNAGLHGGALRGGSYDDLSADVHPKARKLHDPSWQTQDTQDPKSKWWLSDAPFAGFRVVCEDNASPAP